MLMTFISLCLVIFAMLSLSGSAREFNYSQKLKASNTAYLEAVSKANMIVADMTEADSFTVEIDDEFVLFVTCDIDEASGKVEIKEFNKRSVSQWESDDHIKLYQGGN